MAEALDLKPLTDEAIKEMGIDPNELWLVKIDSVVYGPFETESLKHYVSDNEDLFETAEASRTLETEWKPFWAHTKFQRRKLQSVSQTSSEGPYWIMDQGRVKGPISHLEIDKKIEMGLLSMTDHLSLDEGETWIKIYEVEGFDRRTHSADELPTMPHERSFQRAQLEIVQKYDRSHSEVLDELVETVWEGQQRAKVIPFKAEDVQLTPSSGLEVSSSLKWAIPAAMGFILTLVTTGYFMFRAPSESADLALMEETPVRMKRPTMAATRSRGQMPRPRSMPSYRSPSSVGYAGSQSTSYNSGSRYPTHIETHQDNYIEPPEEMEQPILEAEPPQEHSLVEQAQPVEDQNLDAAMNGIPQPEAVVEEASDF
jgi:hypothetical protein